MASLFLNRIPPYLLARLPETLDAFGDYVNTAAMCRRIQSKWRFHRSLMLRALGDYIKSRTGRYHWESVAELIAAFGEGTEGTEDIPNLADARNLEREYGRSKKTYPIRSP